MKRKSLKEVLQFQVATTVFEPNLEITLANLVSEWGDIPYAPLSVVLVYLRFLGILNQTNHWISKSDPFYGDHLLFERIYNNITEEIDGMAEKAVGLGGTQNVNASLQTSQVARLIAAHTMHSTIPQSTDLARSSLRAETPFLRIIDEVHNTLKEMGMLSLGTDNFLAGVADVHESHVYLLKQRCCTESL